ncbi:hypothetical protein [Hymenobacter sp. IS2118]|uniref:hypothetical protein n=1 Tax=Hymenobacter sp. IS2118 TaxID=1505605 RepID=UPI00054E78C1|nr:hypothetical protein [Hymenobacter sp. IS2118]
MKASDIFTPGSLPSITYYDRPNLALEKELALALDTKGMICSISGPSKCGKTVLCETVIDNMLLVTGASITSIDVFWAKIRQALRIEKSTTRTDGRTYGGDLTSTGELSGGIPFVGQAKGAISGKVTAAGQQSSSQAFDKNGAKALFQVLRERGITLVLDDFHYASAAVQITLAQEFKEAAREGTRIVIVTVTQRSDQAIRANGDLRGRVSAIDIPYWQNEELIEIPRRGFAELNITIDESNLRLLVKESVSSPQLMQSLCLRICNEYDYISRFANPLVVTLTAQELRLIFERAANNANCSTAYSILRNGPKPRGFQRNSYRLANGSTGDIYSIILDAIASGEPALSFSYQNLKERVKALITDDSGEPRGIDITKALIQMGNSVKDRLGEDRVLDYDHELETLNILDPYFLYYLRWAKK